MAKKITKKTVKKADGKKVKSAALKKSAVKETVSDKTKKNVKQASKKSVLTTAELAHFQKLLLKKRMEIIGSVNEMQDEALSKSRTDACGDLSSVPIHMADLGTDNYQQEFSLGLVDSERKLLVEIYDALERIENGSYGICQKTGEPITKARLEAKPWAKYCIEYVRKLEQGLVTEDDEE
ncbi:MAG TPA: TraR/DksA C4-type zinc finger protein [Sedimentisphaerales bacterium]|nr:TraR/DksA C4-type zinc finger protein [Sedimentisphaerales bacterium]